MRQEYIQPVTDIMKAETIEMVCASKTLSVYTRFGADTSQSEFAVNEWVNENKSTVTKNGWTVVSAGDDTEDLPSRANEGIWE